jgi:cell division protein FtsZ
MIHFDLPKEKSSIIKVVGVGGGGSNAVNHMFSQEIEGVNFIICNTDAQAIATSPVPNRVQLGPHLTQGLGAGANPEIGRQATEESLEEIKRILEVNTKMAFITAGMGGGTGTGGAPIIAKICKDLGILTVGIVTTPFAYEGRKRQQQAEEGIKMLKQYVDTLLVISNDKLRHQFGNLKMREAFEKADNVLATAAKCITDVINSTGQINVDFADVCTVMRNGGVAILGSAAVSGEGRAYKAIEEALNSPLLNDNDIRGAKWILININSAEGENEFTMDEVEVIQNHLLAQAGEDTDVILGLGYDNTLGDKLGITLIATGFQHKDPFYKSQPKKAEPKKEEEKIVMVLDLKPAVSKEEPLKTADEIIAPAASTLPAEKTDTPSPSERVGERPSDHLAPKLVEDFIMEIPMPGAEDILEMELEKEEPVVFWELNKEEKKTVKAENAGTGKTTVGNLLIAEKDEKIISKPQSQPTTIPAPKEEKNNTKSNNAAPAVSGGYLARPSNIYAEPKAEADASMPAEEPVPSHIAAIDKEETPDLQMQLVERDDIPAAEKLLAQQAQTPLPTDADEPLIADEADEQKRRAVERLHKLRNLSFNVNSADPNNEFETVPAYIRRNMELYNTSNRIEEFYSSYEVKPGKDNQAQISTINTFLDGQKPD